MQREGVSGLSFPHDDSDEYSAMYLLTVATRKGKSRTGNSCSKRFIPPSAQINFTWWCLLICVLLKGGKRRFFFLYGNIFVINLSILPFRRFKTMKRKEEKKKKKNERRKIKGKKWKWEQKTKRVSAEEEEGTKKMKRRHVDSGPLIIKVVSGSSPPGAD